MFVLTTYLPISHIYLYIKLVFKPFFRGTEFQMFLYRIFYTLSFTNLDVHGSVHRNISLIERTNKMQLCSRIYYSNVALLLNMFRATHRPSSGVQKL